jgi:hypothetical protein
MNVQSDEREQKAICIQSFWRMLIHRQLYKITLSRIQSEKKRLFDEIEETNEFVNKTARVDRHNFLKFAKDLIYRNYPGISLEPERYYPKSFSIILKSRPDAIGRSCVLSNRQHSSNNSYFVLNTKNQSVLVKCFKCEGFKELDQTSDILSKMKETLVISDKQTKKTKTKHSNLTNLDHISIIKFDHTTLNVSNDVILDFYDSLEFVTVPAKLDKKCPVFSNWQNRKYQDNVPISFKYNNLAICTGKESNCFVVDVDVNDGGLDWFQKLCTKHNYSYPQATLVVLTPSGGLHLYFKYLEAFSSNSVRLMCDNKPVGVDIRSNAGVVIAPPSKFQQSYRFISMKKPQDCPKFLQDSLLGIDVP